MFVPPSFWFPAKLDPVFLLLNPEQRRQTSNSWAKNAGKFSYSGSEWCRVPGWWRSNWNGPFSDPSTEHVRKFLLKFRIFSCTRCCSFDLFSTATTLFLFSKPAFLLPLVWRWRCSKPTSPESATFAPSNKHRSSFTDRNSSCWLPSNQHHCSVRAERNEAMLWQQTAWPLTSSCTGALKLIRAESSWELSD